MRTTACFDVIRLRADRQVIREAWIERAIRTPLRETKQADGRLQRELDENMLLEIDRDGNICAITIEHSSKRAGAPQFSYDQVAAA